MLIFDYTYQLKYEFSFFTGMCPEHTGSVWQYIVYSAQHLCNNNRAVQCD